MLTGKVAVVTGGSRGIGEAIARRFASNGAEIALIYNSDHNPAARTCTLCRAQRGADCRTYRCDVSSFNETQHVVEAIIRDFGGINILVNNAGITRDGILATMSEDDFKAVVDINLTGAFNMARHCARHFLRNRDGCIINITSVSGVVGNAGQCNYSASKAGLIGFTKSIAKELAPKGIRCNAIAPGYIKTRMTASFMDSIPLEQIPLGRMGEPTDVADAALYLATASYVTGEVIRVDGGIAMY